MAQTIQLNIEGMTCDHCVHAVTTALKDVPGVRDAKVSLADKSALIEGEDVEIDKALAAVAEEGYSASVR
jgi:copper chaperone